jgi:hypothetical protein
MKKYSSAPTYWFRPLHLHFDDGFGAVGDGFQEAALCLEGVLEENQFFNSYLPLAYLYRHAVELYLKSVIIIIHRGLELSFGSLPSSATPMIQADEGWIPIGGVHSVSKLYRYFKTLMDTNMTKLLAAINADWTPLPGELANWIALIDAFDERSTFFRHPGIAGVDKSELGESSIAQLAASMGPRSEPTKGLFEFNEDEQVIGIFQRDRSGLDKILTVLRDTADQLSILHFTLRCELAGGN